MKTHSSSLLGHIYHGCHFKSINNPIITYLLSHISRISCSRNTSATSSNAGSGSHNYYQDLYQATVTNATRCNLPLDVNAQSVFCNNELDLSEVDVYGFDYDYTLAHYSKALHDTIFEMGKRALLETKKYPDALANLSFDSNFAIRGLHFDLKKGFMLKLDAFHHIQRDTVYHGMTRVDWSDVIDHYGGYHVPVKKMNKFHGQGTDMHQFVDVFAVPEISLIVQVIEFFRVNQIDFDPEYVFWDVRNSVQKIHSTGELHHHIMQNLSKYLDKDHRNDGTGALLRRLAEHGKKLFLITNSGYDFINAGMSFLVGSDWRQLFDVIIISARKPNFFIDNQRPFRIYNEELRTFMWHRVTNLEKGVIYTEGSLADLHKFTGWQGSRVLYIGDHVYTDLADATLHHGWRTAAIIPELDSEISILNRESYKRDIMLLVALQDLIEKYQSEAPSDLLREWEIELVQIKKRAKAQFNPQFGSLFRTYHNSTYFSRRLHRFADIYTSRLTNLLHYSADHSFFPRRGALSHEQYYVTTNSG